MCSYSVPHACTLHPRILLHVYVCVCTCTCTYVRIYATHILSFSLCLFLSVSVSLSLSTHTHHKHTHSHTHTHTHTHTLTHTHVMCDRVRTGSVWGWWWWRSQEGDMWKRPSLLNKSNLSGTLISSVNPELLPDLWKPNILNNVLFWVAMRWSWAHASLPPSILAIVMDALQSAVAHWR